MIWRPSFGAPHSFAMVLVTTLSHDKSKLSKPGLGLIEVIVTYASRALEQMSYGLALDCLKETWFKASSNISFVGYRDNGASEPTRV